MAADGRGRNRPPAVSPPRFVAPPHGPHLGNSKGPLPRNGDELAQMIMARLRWYAYRIRFHPWTTEELPKILGTIHDYIRLTRLDRPIGIWLLLWPTLWALRIA